MFFVFLCSVVCVLSWCWHIGVAAPNENQILFYPIQHKYRHLIELNLFLIEIYNTLMCQDKYCCSLFLVPLIGEWFDETSFRIVSSFLLFSNEQKWLKLLTTVRWHWKTAWIILITLHKFKNCIRVFVAFLA